MLRRLFQGVVVLSLIAGPSFGDDGEARGKLIGTWRQNAGDNAGAVWTLEDTGETLRITHSLEGQKVAEYECNTMGRECDLKDSGKHGQISMWFNGPALVLMETRGSDVIKRRFKAVEKGDTMELEVIPLVPAGKTEVIQLQRLPVSVAYK